MYLYLMDKGIYWEVLDTSDSSTVNTNVHTFMKESDSYMIYKTYNEEIFHYITENIKEKNKIVTFPKVLNGPLGYDNISILDKDVPDPIKITKNNAIRKMRDHFVNNSGFNTVFLIYGFITANNMLLEKGYVITDENREEKYLEIINTGDEDLISTLEKFLESKDGLSIPYYCFNTYRTYISKLNEASTVDDVTNVLNEFLYKFADVTIKGTNEL